MKIFERKNNGGLESRMPNTNYLMLTQQFSNLTL